MDQTSEIDQNPEMNQTPEMDQNLEMDQNPSYEVFSICRSCNLVNLRFYWSGIYPNLIGTPFRMFKENLFDHQVDQVLLLLKQTLRKVGRRRLKCFSFQSTTSFLLECILQKTCFGWWFFIFISKLVFTQCLKITKNVSFEFSRQK